jgi:hypothetical protein
MDIRMNVILDQTAFPEHPEGPPPAAKSRFADPSDRFIRKEVHKAAVPLHVEWSQDDRCSRQMLKIHHANKHPKDRQTSPFSGENHEYKD